MSAGTRSKIVASNLSTGWHFLGDQRVSNLYRGQPAQTGMAPMNRDIAVKKLQALAAGAALARQRYGAAGVAP